MAGLNFEVKDEACTGPLGVYYEKFYYRPNPHDTVAGQLHLGKSAIDASTALEKAEAALAIRRLSLIHI